MLFLSKLNDCDDENSETDSSFDFAKYSGYISIEVHKNLVNKNRKIGKILGFMISNPTSFIIKKLTCEHSSVISNLINQVKQSHNFILLL